MGSAMRKFMDDRKQRSEDAAAEKKAAMAKAERAKAAKALKELVAIALDLRQQIAEEEAQREELRDAAGKILADSDERSSQTEAYFRTEIVTGSRFSPVPPDAIHNEAAVATDDVVNEAWLLMISPHFIRAPPIGAFDHVTTMFGFLADWKYIYERSYDSFAIRDRLCGRFYVPLMELTGSSSWNPLFLHLRFDVPDENGAEVLLRAVLDVLSLMTCERKGYRYPVPMVELATGAVVALELRVFKLRMMAVARPALGPVRALVQMSFSVADGGQLFPSNLLVQLGNVSCILSKTGTAPSVTVALNFDPAGTNVPMRLYSGARSDRQELGLAAVPFDDIGKCSLERMCTLEVLGRTIIVMWQWWYVQVAYNKLQRALR